MIAKGSDAYGRFLDLTVGGVVQRFRWCPPGRFMMGSPRHEWDRCADETQHEVTLTRGFWLADTACTQAFWLAVAPSSSIVRTGPEHPVHWITWHEATTFTSRVAALLTEGVTFRLPTEAEWEYACRAGTTTPFSFGETVTTDQVNFDGDFPYLDSDPKGVNRNQTVAVKSLPANPWGLYEMHGNVWEWCADWYSCYDPMITADPTGPASGYARVRRGASFYYEAESCRSACRDGEPPDHGPEDAGFRLVLEVTDV